MGVDKNLESTQIREGDDEIEVISVQVLVGDLPLRIILGYGPQENADAQKKEKFWTFLEREINKAEANGEGIILQMDGNLHAGETLIKDDPNPQNVNGKLFMDFLKRNPALTVVNSLSLCEGLITRMRKVESRTEKAVLDFFVVNEKLRPFLNKMIVDESREY